VGRRGLSRQSCAVAPQELRRQALRRKATRRKLYHRRHPLGIGIWSVILSLSPVIAFYMLMVA